MFYVYISHTRVSVCTPRDMQQLKGDLGEKTERPHDKQSAPFWHHQFCWRLKESFLYQHTFIMEDSKFTYIFETDHDISLLSGPFPYMTLLLEGHAGGKIWEANFNYVTLPLSWLLYSFLYGFFF